LENIGCNYSRGNCRFCSCEGGEILRACNVWEILDEIIIGRACLFPEDF
jgi:hypothetical protein